MYRATQSLQSAMKSVPDHDAVPSVRDAELSVTSCRPSVKNEVSIRNYASLPSAMQKAPSAMTRAPANIAESFLSLAESFLSDEVCTYKQSGTFPQQ
ncbi:MAG: hypothetical protein DYG99_13220 [Bacteroidetes bacterium CHB5]|nr:hypothetical protein [Bacteroidetes bacterium CHB5]